MYESVYISIYILYVNDIYHDSTWKHLRQPCANLAPSLCFAGFPCMTPRNELVKPYKSVGCVPPRLKVLFRTFDRLSCGMQSSSRNGVLAVWWSCEFLNTKFLWIGNIKTKLDFAIIKMICDVSGAICFAQLPCSGGSQGCRASVPSNVPMNYNYPSKPHGLTYHEPQQSEGVSC